MATQPNHDPLELDRTNLRTAAIGLLVWVGITLTVVAFLLVYGGVLTSVFP